MQFAQAREQLQPAWMGVHDGWQTQQPLALLWGLKVNLCAKMVKAVPCVHVWWSVCLCECTGYRSCCYSFHVDAFRNRARISGPPSTYARRKCQGVKDWLCTDTCTSLWLCSVMVALNFTGRFQGL